MLIELWAPLSSPITTPLLPLPLPPLSSDVTRTRAASTLGRIGLPTTCAAPTLLSTIGLPKLPASGSVRNDVLN
jgi:hypothetical protein